jgi:hypothetical protein
MWCFDKAIHSYLSAAAMGNLRGSANAMAEEGESPAASSAGRLESLVP